MTNFHHFHDEVDLRLSFVYSEGDFAPSLPHSLVVTHVMNQWQELISRRLEDVLRCMAFLGHLTPIGALPKGAHEYSWLTYFFFFFLFLCVCKCLRMCVYVLLLCWVLGQLPV